MKTKTGTTNPHILIPIDGDARGPFSSFEEAAAYSAATRPGERFLVHTMRPPIKLSGAQEKKRAAYLAQAKKGGRS